MLKEDAGAMIHVDAHVDDAFLDVGATVWQFASVIRGAKLGCDTVVGACAMIDGAKIGDRCRIGHGASIHPGTVLGDGVFVGPGAVFCNDMWPSVEKTGWRLPEKATVIVGDMASIGAGAIVLPGVRIGVGAVVAAGAVVDRDLPANAVWRRNGYISDKPDNWRVRRMRYAA